MTSPPPPDEGLPLLEDPDPDDDAVLAVLDGTATPEQRRRVARDPALRDRLDEQHSAVTALRTPVTALAEDVTARLRARALDDEDDRGDPGRDDGDAAADGADPGADGAVVPLATRRRRRRPGWPAVAAVVILLMSIGLTLIVTDRPDGDTVAQLDLTGEDLNAAEAARDLGADAAGDGSGSAEDDAPPGAAATEESGAASSRLDSDELVHYPDQDALERELRAVDPATLQPPGAGPTQDATTDRATEQAAFCDTGLRAVDASLQPVQAARLVVVDELDVLVMSNPVRATANAPASIRLTALDARSCTPLFAVQR